VSTPTGFEQLIEAKDGSLVFATNSKTGGVRATNLGSRRAERLLDSNGRTTVAPASRSPEARDVV